MMCKLFGHKWQIVYSGLYLNEYNCKRCSRTARVPSQLVNGLSEKGLKKFIKEKCGE